jgi:hypothetical protein
LISKSRKSKNFQFWFSQTPLKNWWFSWINWQEWVRTPIVCERNLETLFIYILKCFDILYPYIENFQKHLGFVILIFGYLDSPCSIPYTRVNFHIDKKNNNKISKNEFFFKIKNHIYFQSSIAILWKFVKRVMKLLSVASDNYDDFQHVNFIFSHIFIFTILRII